VILFHRAGTRWAVQLLWEPRDLWVGVFWQRPYYEGLARSFTAYLCLLPMLPLRVTYTIPDALLREAS
jgi:hypothetical protein